MQTTSKKPLTTSAHQLVDLLNQSLADTLDLKLQAKQAHWNVKGENFIALHQLFDDVASAVEEYADMLAERVIQLGGTAKGTAQTVAETSALNPYPTEIHTSVQHVIALTNSLRAVADSNRVLIDTSDALGDKVTADLFTEIARGLDKWRWFVESNQ